ncbi:MAG: hypothetical protein SVJ22_01785 [Halobacteriota archaeon]|nr:hypothetical protein [Halobacteriota archaeon]
MIIIVSIVAFSGCTEEDIPGPSPTIIPTPTPETPKTSDSCEMCHSDASKELLHVQGGNLCNQCHGGSDINVHDIHPTLSCTDCHDGSQPGIPKAAEGHTVCENCHAYPDASKPSYGNLVEIHIPRGIGCTVCHTGPISQIHG